ncbi:sigma-70 family RNA polymerase sigma factor [Pseudoflavonifractor phocaeensis]|uniref:RNA polymerase sigma factor n=1 Tax=Pseudoflavonifractor phocaeensis TaxID=1870988 RepID=UPI0025A42DA9|nr:sigma-70 family RNA polymerase sigma factor [Pseudoflavonifractor phocaeensis]MDM8239821.1 sigma-70 family RNA polymerase sigma factor [Pseudoflavonifractor phocaeensis]
MNRAHSQEEMAALYRRHVSMVYQICLMLLKNVPDAEDATQNVFRKVMEQDKPFRDPEHEKAWLIVTARNECRDQLKHWWRRNWESETALLQVSSRQPEDSGLKELIWELPEQDRLVLYLYYYQGYTAQEIAELLGKNPSTVRTWLVRARKKLKLRMEAEGYDIP